MHNLTLFLFVFLAAYTNVAAGTQPTAGTVHVVYSEDSLTAEITVETWDDEDGSITSEVTQTYEVQTVKKYLAVRLTTVTDTYFVRSGTVYRLARFSNQASTSTQLVNIGYVEADGAICFGCR